MVFVYSCLSLSKWETETTTDLIKCLELVCKLLALSLSLSLSCARAHTHALNRMIGLLVELNMQACIIKSGSQHPVIICSRGAVVKVLTHLFTGLFTCRKYSRFRTHLSVSFVAMQVMSGVMRD